MKSAFGSFIVAPLLGIALVVRLVGFRTLYIVRVSVLGEIAGLFLYSAYNNWKVGSVLSGLAPGLSRIVVRRVQEACWVVFSYSLHKE
ncbi:MAG TPA: hypothetical protein VJ840_13275 [Gemmatimonadaceae bacterium]|nr:hypothetical protein [Gemmatimonadaceae bacterium]